jgi:hypothetical protein
LFSALLAIIFGYIESMKEAKTNDSRSS